MNERFKKHDGGRKASGVKTANRDCVCRAICIATGRPYAEVWNRLRVGNITQRKSKRTKQRKNTAGDGIYTGRKWFKDYMAELGFVWVPTMQIGSGCKVHHTREELPAGRLVVSLSKHYSTMIDGVIVDTYDPSRNGTRCVYGYWKLEVEPERKPELDPPEPEPTPEELKAKREKIQAERNKPLLTKHEDGCVTFTRRQWTVISDRLEIGDCIAECLTSDGGSAWSYEQVDERARELSDLGPKVDMKDPLNHAIIEDALAGSTYYGSRDMTSHDRKHMEDVERHLGLSVCTW